MSHEKLRAVLAEVASAMIKPQPLASTATTEAWRDRQLERFRRKGEEALALLDAIGTVSADDRQRWRPIDEAARSGVIIEVLVRYLGVGERRHLIVAARWNGRFTLIDEYDEETGDHYIEPLAWRPAPDPELPSLGETAAAVAVLPFDIKTEFSLEIILDILLGTRPPIALSKAFVWNDTPQGEPFWREQAAADTLTPIARRILVASVKADAEKRRIIRFPHASNAELARDILAGKEPLYRIDLAFIFANTAEGSEFWYATAASIEISPEARISLERGLRVFDATKEAA